MAIAGGGDVDFVVVGLGLGALAILAGVLLLGWLAGRWERSARASAPDDAAHDYAMAAWRRGSGQALLGAGSAVLLATIGALAGSLTDQTGAFLVTTTATVAALGLLFWAYLYRARHPIPARRALPAERASRQTGPALPSPGVAATPATAPLTVAEASRAAVALPLADQPDASAAEPDSDSDSDSDSDPAPDPAPVIAPALSQPLDEAREPGDHDATPPSDRADDVDEAGDATEPAAPPQAASAATGDADEEEVPAPQEPGAGPKIVELAAFAARTGKARAASGGDDE